MKRLLSSSHLKYFISLLLMSLVVFCSCGRKQTQQADIRATFPKAEPVVRVSSLSANYSERHRSTTLKWQVQTSQGYKPGFKVCRLGQGYQELAAQICSTRTFGGDDSIWFSAVDILSPEAANVDYPRDYSVGLKSGLGVERHCSVLTSSKAKAKAKAIAGIMNTVNIQGAPCKYEDAKIISEFPERKRLMERIEAGYCLSDALRLAKREIWIGMSENALQWSWGWPNDINTSVGIWGTHKQYVYGEYDSKYVYVENGIVTAYQL